jgi:hypothetical protein
MVPDWQQNRAAAYAAEREILAKLFSTSQDFKALIARTAEIIADTRRVLREVSKNERPDT